MNFLNSIAADLVEKRLWPVAAVLGAGAVVAPMGAQLLDSHAGSAAPPAGLRAPSARPPSSAAITALVAQLRPDAGVIPLGAGGFHDPFASAPAATVASASPPGASTASHPGSVPPPASTPPSSGSHSSGSPLPVAITPPTAVKIHHGSLPATPVPHVTPVQKPPSSTGHAPGSGGGSTGSGSPLVPGSPTGSGTPTGSGLPSASGAPSGPGSSTGTQAPSHAAPVRTRPRHHHSLVVYRADLRFGQAASAQTITNPVRLTPLPSAADPQILYLGVTKSGKSAAFLVPKTGVATGDGVCRPTPTRCEVVTLKAGETEFLDIRSPTAGLVQYELNVTRISSRHSASAAQAAVAHRRESEAGRALLKRVNSTVLEELAFSPSLGTVIDRPKTTGTATNRQSLPQPRVETPAPAAAPTAPAPAPASAPTAGGAPVGPPAAGAGPARPA